MIWLRIREWSRTSLWFIPLLIGIGVTALLIALIYLEKIYGPFTPLGWLDEVSTDAFSVTLSTLLAAIITVFGILLPITFSIILRATSQYTPKILRVYRSSISPKIFLGLVIATTLYFMVLLIIVNYIASKVSPFTIALSFLLIILTVFSIPAFFDRLASSLEPVYLIEQITNDLKSMLKNFERFQESSNPSDYTIKQNRYFLEKEEYNFRINANRTGYISSIDCPALLELNKKNQIFGAVPVRPGDFVIEGTPILRLKTNEQLNEELQREYISCFSFNNRRLGISDLELQLDELLSIVLRALSSQVSDLFTAIECMNHIGSVCNQMLNRRFNTGIYRDKEGMHWLFTKEFDFLGFIHAAFDPIRQNARTQPSVIIAVLEIIQSLINNCRFKERAAILKEVAFQFFEEMQSFPHEYDKNKMQRYLKAIESSVDKISELGT